MKLQDIYRKGVEAGILCDPRGKKGVADVLREEAEKKKALDKNEKERSFYDEDRLWNPYADSRILYGTPTTDVKTVLVGIDMEVSELLLADRLTEKGTKIDAVIAHHPDGHALANFYEVMDIQTDVFHTRGVPVVIAESLTKERMSEVGRSVSSANHMRTVDAARLLDMPLVCLHTPADNHVYNFLQKMFDAKKPARVKQVLELLKEIPEYKEARKYNAGPFILQGSPEAKAGTVLVDMTGGTEGSRDIFSRLAQSGVGTIVCMHMSEAHFKKAKEERINVINAGHIASDNLGINLMLDAITKKEKLTILEASGFRRVTRRA